MEDIREDFGYSFEMKSYLLPQGQNRPGDYCVQGRSSQAAGTLSLEKEEISCLQTCTAAEIGLMGKAITAAKKVLGFQEISGY